MNLETAITRALSVRARFGPLEAAFWIVAFATVYLLPDQHLILTEIAIWGLFALSLDLILGYAGILSLGHAAFFGAGAYAAGLLAKYEIVTEPSVALLAAGFAAAGLGFATSFLVLRGSDLTRLMVTLGVSLVCFELANKFAGITGGADGLQGVTIAPLFGIWRFDLYGHTGLCVFARCPVHPRHAGAADRQLAIRAVAQGHQGQPATERRYRHRGQPPARRDLYSCRRSMPE